MVSHYYWFMCCIVYGCSHARSSDDKTVTETILASWAKIVTIGLYTKNTSKPVDFLALTSGSGFERRHFMFLTRLPGKATIYGCLRNSTRDSICAKLWERPRHEWRKAGLSLLLSNQTLRKFCTIDSSNFLSLMFPPALWLSLIFWDWFWYISTWFLASSL